MYEEYFNLNTFTGEKYPISIYHNNKELKVIPGKTILRRDAGTKVTGQAKYASDIILPNMCFLKTKLSPYSHAKVKKIDISKAKALPGVLLVLTPAEAPFATSPPFDYVLNTEVFISGDEIAAVVAEEEDIAEEAVTLIDVEYEQLPFILYAEESMKSGAPILRGTTNEVGAQEVSTRGNVDTGFAAADKVVEGLYDSVSNYGPLVSRSHADMETEVCTATLENGQLPNSRLIVWTATQTPFNEQRLIANALGLPHNRVHCPYTATGASMGGKGSGGKIKILTAFAAMKLNRPVRGRAGSEAQFSTSRQQNTQSHTIKVGVKNDGTLTAIQDISIAAGGRNSGRAASGGQSVLKRLYTCPNLSLVGRDFITNSNTAGSPRCVPHPRAQFPIQIHFDRVAEAVGMNPADFSLKNAFTGSRTGTDQDNPKYDIGSNPMPGLLEKLIEVSGWRSKWKGWKTPVAVNGAKRIGIGMAIHQCSHGGMANPQAATILLQNDGTFHVACGSQETGNGWRTAASLMAAEELGVPAEMVNCGGTDTDITPESAPTYGSLAVRSSGTAIICAARDVKAQLFRLAITAKLVTATKPEELETADGYIYLKSDPTKKVAIKDVASKQTGTYVDIDPAQTGGGQIVGRGSHVGKGIQPMQWNVQAAEVEVDSNTGEYTVLNVWSVHGCGRAIWYPGANNQGVGGVYMSMGMTTSEGLVRDSATGIPLNANYLDYKIPTHLDAPNVNMVLVDEIDPFGPFGAKGIAEPMSTATAPAVANAIYNAVGARVYNPPITPDKILMALGKA